MARHPLLLIFCGALAVRWTYSLVLYIGLGDAGLSIEDSGAYIAAARLMRETGAAYPIMAGTASLPDTSYMPAYFWFLVALMRVFGDANHLVPVLGQGIIDSLTCVIIASSAALLSARTGLVAGLAAVFNPTQIVIGGLLLTETLFTFCCALMLWCALRYLTRPRLYHALALGGAIGGAILVRAMAFPWALALPIVMLIAVIIAGRFSRRVWPALAAIGIALIIAVTPIAQRNHDMFGSYSLSSQGGDHFLLWVVPLVRETIDGTPHDVSAAALNATLEARARVDQVDAPRNPLRESRAKTDLALRTLVDYGARAVAKAYAFGAAINLGAPAIILSPPVRGLPRTGFYDTPGTSKGEKVFAFLFRNDNPLYGWVLLLSALGVGIVRVIQLWGLWTLLRGDRLARAAAFVLVAWIGYVLAINGPIASAKYRHPAEPALIVLFAMAWAAPGRRADPTADVPTTSRLQG